MPMTARTRGGNDKTVSKCTACFQTPLSVYLHYSFLFYTIHPPVYAIE